MTQTTAVQLVDTQRDVYGIINDKIIDHLEKGIVPWRMPWYKAGIPTNLVSGNQYKGINVALLSSLGYERNLFVSENQLEEINGAIKPKEKPHLIASWNIKEGEKTGSLGYRKVYNVAQCVGVNPGLVVGPLVETDRVEALRNIISNMQASPAIKNKDAGLYYDARLDVVNAPKAGTFAMPELYYLAVISQLIHSTGHFSRLDRIGLAQMENNGYPTCSIEMLVTEIAMHYFLSLTGCAVDIELAGKPVADWLVEIKRNRTYIFTAYSLVVKAIGFIHGKEAVVEDKTQ